MLDLKYLKPREETDDCTLVVVSDGNDDDITENTSWSMEEIKDTLPYFWIIFIN